jgi:hypothetical protein
MKTMLEPRMVAARTHRPQPGSRRSDIPARIATSSHGGLAALAMRRLPFHETDSSYPARDVLREITDATAEFS